MQKWYLVFVLALGSLVIGCLGDDIVEEVKPRPILQPGLVKFKAEDTGDLVAQWAPSLSDTQTNFKGYYVELFRSMDTVGEIDNIIDTFAVAHTPKSDTSYTFKNVPPGRYTLQVWGQRIDDPDNPDTLVLSKFPAIYSFTFDPLPIVAPSELLAHSEGQNFVAVSWKASASFANPGMVGYVIRYRDNTSTSSKIYTHSRPGNGATPAPISIQFPSTSDAIEVPYKIWIKGVRNDSTESADSAVIVWSGARSLGLGLPTIVEAGKKLFIGQTNAGYEMKQLDAPTSQILVNVVDSSVTLQALEGAKFATRIDTGELKKTFFKEPFPDSAFTETSVTLPRNPPTHISFYILFAKVDGVQARARIVLTLDEPSKTLIHANNSIHAQAIFQPGVPPYYLPYF